MSHPFVQVFFGLIQLNSHWVRQNRPSTAKRASPCAGMHSKVS